jgi:hypothetical protein
VAPCIVNPAEGWTILSETHQDEPPPSVVILLVRRYRQVRTIGELTPKLRAPRDPRKETKANLGVFSM